MDYSSPTFEELMFDLNMKYSKVLCFITVVNDLGWAVLCCVIFGQGHIVFLFVLALESLTTYAITCWKSISYTVYAAVIGIYNSKYLHRKNTHIKSTTVSGPFYVESLEICDNLKNDEKPRSSSDQCWLPKNRHKNHSRGVENFGPQCVRLARECLQVSNKSFGSLTNDE